MQPYRGPNKPLMGEPLVLGDDPINKDLVGWWNFLEGAGDQLYDLSINENHGTLTNMETGDWKNGGPKGLEGAYLDFASNDYVDIPDHPSFAHGSGDVTWAGWLMMPSGAATNVSMCAKTATSGAIGWNFWIDADTQAGAIEPNLFTPQGKITGSEDLRGKGWIPWAFCRIGNDRTNWKLYTRGVEDTGVTEGGSDISGSITSTAPMRIAARLTSPTSYWTGSMSQLRIWNRELSAHEIWTLANRPFYGLYTRRVILVEVDIVGGAIYRGKNETLDISELVGRYRTLNRGENETLNLTESPSRVVGLFRGLNETLNISELIGSALGKVASINETLNLTEGVGWFRGAKKGVSETLNISELIGTHRTLYRALNETLNISELIGAYRTLFRAIGETLNLSELVGRVVASYRGLNETLNVSESVGNVRGLIKGVVETLNLSELTGRFLAQPVGVILRTMAIRVVPAAKAVGRVIKSVKGVGRINE